MLFLTRFASAEFDVTGSITTVGYSLMNEPLQHEILQTDSGFLFRADAGVHWQYRDLLSADTILAVEGPSRYGLLIGDSRNTLFGRYKSVSTSDLRPYVDSASIRFQSPQKHIMMESGIIRHGSDDKYANPGINMRGVFGRFRVGLHYSDVGTRGGILHPAAELTAPPDGIEAHFLHGFIQFSDRFLGPRSFLRSFDVSLSVGFLRDRTPPDHRWNALRDTWGSIARDDLGTASLRITAEIPFTTLTGGYSENFGRAISETGERADRAYTGTCFDAGVRVRYGMVELYAGYMNSSGDPFDKQDLVNERPPSDFEGYVDYPPTDLGLYDSHYIRHDLPLVFTGGTYTAFFGLPRPGYQRDAYSIENLEMSRLESRLFPLPDWAITMRYWHVRADQCPWMYQDGRWVQPSKDLGDEFDFEIQYTLFDRIEIWLFYGLAVTGQYYADSRDSFAPGPVTDEASAPYLSGRTVTLAEVGVTVTL